MKVVARFWECTSLNNELREEINVLDLEYPSEAERGKEFLVIHSSVLEAIKEGKV